MLKRFNTIFSVIIITSLMSSSILAQAGEDDYSELNYKNDVTKVGTSAATFLEIAIGARAEAMGSAFTAISNDVTALYWNPAGIVQLGKIGFSVNHAEWLADTKLQNFGLVVPASNDMAFGVSLTLLDYMDKQPVRTIARPEGTGEYYDASDLMIGLSFAMSLTDRFSFGLTTKYIRESIWHESADAFAIDLGLLYKTQFKGLTLGAAISNFGTDMLLDGRDLLRPFDEDPQNYSNDKLNVNLKTDPFSLPLLFRFGIAYSKEFTENHKASLAVDLNHPSNNVETVNVGLEYTIMNLIVLRGGYQSLFDNNSENGLTLGVGVNSPMFNSLQVVVNYSYSAWGLLGDVQRFSIDLNF